MCIFEANYSNNVLLFEYQTVRVTMFLFQYEWGLQNNLWNKNFLLTLGRGLSIKHSWLIIVKLSMHHQQTCTLINCWIFKIYKIFYSELINHHYFSIVGFEILSFIFSHHDDIKLPTNQTAISWQWTLTKSFYAKESKLISCFLNALIHCFVKHYLLVQWPWLFLHAQFQFKSPKHLSTRN